MVRRFLNVLNYVKEILRSPAEHTREFTYRDVPFFLQFAKPVWKTGIISLFLTFVMTAISSVLPLSSKVLIDFVVLKKDLKAVDHFLSAFGLSFLADPLRHSLQSVTLVVTGVLFIGAAAGITGIIQKYLVLRFQQELTFNLQATLFDNLLRFSLPFFKERQTGYLMSRVSDDIYALQILFSEGIMQVFARTFYSFFGFVIVFALSTKLSLILAAVLPVYLLINYFFGARIRDISIKERESSAHVSSDIQEVLSGVETIKAYTAEEREVQKVTQKMRTVMRTRMKSMFLSLFSNYAAAGSLFAANLVIMWTGIHEVLHGRLTIGDYVAFTSYVILLSGSLNTVLSFHIMIQPVFASLQRLKEMFSLIPEFGEGKGGGAFLKPDEIRGEVTFENVSFSYEKGRSALRNISFSAHTGEIIAFVGPSGAGKTTLINLLLKFYIPQAGSVYLDGRDLQTLSAKWLREQIGVVSQDVFLFDDTVEKNIKYGNPFASREDVIEAAKLANIHNDIEGFHDKYETEIGERGVRLSAGQRQRISIARAFLKGPAILIFDEPTSALDAATETSLKDSIKKLSKKRTTFIIGHRLSLIDTADRILVLDGGKIVESGTNEELRRMNGMYKRLLDAQSTVAY